MEECNNLCENDDKRDKSSDDSPELKNALHEIDAKKMMGAKPVKINKTTVQICIASAMIVFFWLIVHYSEVRPDIIKPFESPLRTDISNIGLSSVLPQGFSASADDVTGYFSRNDGAKIYLRKRRVSSLHDTRSANKSRFTCVYYGDNLLEEFSKEDRYELVYSNPAVIAGKEGALVTLEEQGNSRFDIIKAAAVKQKSVISEVIVMIPDRDKDLSEEQYSHLFGSLKSIPIVMKKPEVKVIKKKTNSNEMIKKEDK
ncbi:MAG: hypothetical protein ACYTFY_03960 [Planctomycetota bacterium]|jgi:hypothetical protein